MITTTTTGSAGFRALIERRIKSQEMFAVLDVASVFGVCATKVREWIDDGTLPVADLNAGIFRHGQPMRPLWRVTRQAILDLAERMEKGGEQ
jgi:hypothetical protein